MGTTAGLSTTLATCDDHSLQAYKMTVAPVVQLVTSKSSDTLGREFESPCSHTNWDFPHQKKRKKAQYICGER